MPRVKNNDVSKPRGRMSSYAFFVQTCREEHKRKNPGENVVFADFSRECAERWKVMSTNEKKRFQDMADRDKARYDMEMKHYIPPKGEKGVRGGKKKKDPNAPKGPISSFFWFCNDERGKIKSMNPEYGIGDIAKVLGKLWAQAEPGLKQKYGAIALTDKHRYERELAAYKQRGGGVNVPQGDDEDDDEDEDE